MSSRNFFICCLLLPPIGAVLGSLIAELNVLVFYFMVGLIPYFPLAIVLATLVHRATSFRRLLILSAVAPVVFGVMFAVFFAALDYVPAMHMTALQFGGQFLSLAGVSGGIACCYVGVAWVLWVVCRRMRWVANEFASQGASRSR